MVELETVEAWFKVTLTGLALAQAETTAGGMEAFFDLDRSVITADTMQTLQQGRWFHHVQTLPGRHAPGDWEGPDTDGRGSF